MKNCVFCKIMNKLLPAKIIKENDFVFAIEDKFPKAPIHYLIIPKRHIEDLKDITEDDRDFLWGMLRMIRDLAKELPGSKSFNVLSNNGRDAGQSVPHLHWHFISGRGIGEDF